MVTLIQRQPRSAIVADSASIGTLDRAAFGPVCLSGTGRPASYSVGSCAEGVEAEIRCSSSLIASGMSSNSGVER